MNQCWYVVNWALGMKLQWFFFENSYIFTKENAFEKSSGKWLQFCLGPNDKHRANSWRLVVVCCVLVPVESTHMIQGCISPVLIYFWYWDYQSICAIVSLAGLIMQQQHFLITETCLDVWGSCFPEARWLDRRTWGGNTGKWAVTHFVMGFEV